MPEEFHGQRSLEGYSPWGRKEWGVTEQLPYTHTHTHTHTETERENGSSELNSVQIRATKVMPRKKMMQEDRLK